MMMNVNKVGVFLLIPVCGFVVGKLIQNYPSYCKKDDQKKEHNNDDEEVQVITSTDQHDARGCVLDDILGVKIMERLSLVNQARFRAVCKDWLAIHRNYYTTIRSLPWYVQYDRQLAVVSKKLEFRLYDPLSTPNLVSTQCISLTKLGIPSPPHPDNTVFAQKNSWLLICIKRRKLFSKSRQYFLAYSPFTKQLIKLPTFDYPSRVRFQVMFTTVPDSPSCAFCLLSTPIVDKFVCVTYRNGDSGWTIREFDRVDAFVPCDCQFVFIGGIIMYIVSPNGQLASYNIDDGKFRYENLVADEIFTLNCTSPGSIYRVFELNGELMMLYLHMGEIPNTSPMKPCLKQFDWSDKVWIPVTNLGDTTLFVRYLLSSSVAIIKKEEMRYNGILSNKIYYFFDGGYIIYSLENGELVEFKSINSSSLKDGPGEYNYIGGMMQTAIKVHHFINPPKCVR